MAVNRHIVVCGDFNINLFINSPLTTKFYNHTQMLNLHQVESHQHLNLSWTYVLLAIPTLL